MELRKPHFKPGLLQVVSSLMPNFKQIFHQKDKVKKYNVEHAWKGSNFILHHKGVEMDNEAPHLCEQEAPDSQAAGQAGGLHGTGHPTLS